MLCGTAQAQMMKVSGYVNAPEELREPVKITVVSDDGEVVWQKEKKHPSVNFKVPADRTYDITFEQEGSLTKTVHIDARKSIKPYTKKQMRKVAFEVIMERTDSRHLRFAGPVGKIDFSNNTGNMNVEYDYRLEQVAQERHQGNKRNY
jgi:hypothetical protein